jgi:hypothetical protein
MRREWPLPSDDELRAHIEGYHRASLDERLERYKFIWREFGPPTDMLLTGGMSAVLAIHELRLCYIEGYYLACILLAQIFIEQSFGGSYIIAGEEDTAEEGFARLINAALADNVIDSSLANRLHELRRIRNAYVHPKAGLGKGTLMGRMLEKYQLGKRYESEADFAKEDAEQAIQIVVDFMRNNSSEDEPPMPDKSKAT